LKSPIGLPPLEHAEHALEYAYNTPYTDMLYARPTVTSFAVQTARRQAIMYTKRATAASTGLHRLASRNANQHPPDWSDFTPDGLRSLEVLTLNGNPVLAGFLMPIALPVVRSTTKPGSVVAVRRRTEIVVVRVMNILYHSHNRHTKRYALGEALFNWQAGSQQKVFDFGSRVSSTPTYSTAHTTLTILDGQEIVLIHMLGVDILVLLMDGFNSIQQYAKLWEACIGRKTKMQMGMFGGVIEMQDCNPNVLNLADWRAWLACGLRSQLNYPKLLDLYSWDHLRQVYELSWLHTLVWAIPALAPLKPKVIQLYWHTPLSACVDPHCKSKVHSLQTNGFNPAVTAKCLQGFCDFEAQSGLPKGATVGILITHRLCSGPNAMHYEHYASGEIWRNVTSMTKRDPVTLAFVSLYVP
jgi:hypothetical protein